MNFAEKMDELEKILRDLEGDSLTLDSALAEYERGVALVRECRAYRCLVPQGCGRKYEREYEARHHGGEVELF